MFFHVRSQLSRSHLARILFLNSEKTKPSLIVDIGQTETVLLLAVIEDNKTIVQFVHVLLQKDYPLRIGFSNSYRTLIWANDKYVRPRSPWAKCGTLRPCEQRESTITLSKADQIISHAYPTLCSILSYFHFVGTLASSSLANMTVAGHVLFFHSLFLVKNCQIAFLKMFPRAYSLIWPLPHPKTDYQGLAIKVLNSSYQKPPLATLSNISS